MTTTGRPQRLVSNMRGVRYGEVLAAYARDGSIEAEVYGTQMLNDCPQELWSTLDAAAIACVGGEHLPVSDAAHVGDEALRAVSGGHGGRPFAGNEKA